MTVYSKTTIVGTSGTSVSDAIRGAVQRAQQSFDDLQWFEVKETRGAIKEGKPEYQVTLELGFALHARSQGDAQAASDSAPGTRAMRSQAAQEASMRGERGRSDLAEGFRDASDRQ